MLKSVLLATSVIFAVPALAQEKPARDVTQEQQATPAQDQAATPAADATSPGQQDPATTAQANPQSTPAPAAQTAQPTPSQPAQSAAQQPAATQEQVAQVVGRDFGTYDKNADDKLDQTEFANWMGTLRKASEPSFNPGSPEAATWAGQAFAAADTDKNASINKQELTAFLTPKRPS